MPSKGAIKCSSPGCGGIVLNGVCSICGPKRKWNWKDDKQRGARQARGYDQAWLNCRAQKLAADPLCERCEKEGRVEEASQVHHKIPFKGPADPLRLEWSNLESICETCHQRERHR